MIAPDNSSSREQNESFDDFLDRIWGEDYSAWASVFPAGIVAEWKHMDAAMKKRWRLQTHALRDEVVQ